MLYPLSYGRVTLGWTLVLPGKGGNLAKADAEGKGAHEENLQAIDVGPWLCHGQSR